MLSSDHFHIDGYVSRGFEAVGEAFSQNFTQRHELGGACCVYYKGEKVIDLWGGIRNKQSHELWERDTVVVVHSATKGLAAMTLAIAHSRGWLDYEERVCTYWPEFAQQGKEQITVRQLLAHQAGLFAINEPVDYSIVADLDRLAVVLARQKPAWEPGTRQAYHGLSLGFYEGELLRRVDRDHRSLGQFFQEEIATPLGEDAYIRLPETIPNSRLATLAAPGRFQMLFGLPNLLPLPVLAVSRCTSCRLRWFDTFRLRTRLPRGKEPAAIAVCGLAMRFSRGSMRSGGNSRRTPGPPRPPAHPGWHPAAPSLSA